MKWPVAHDAINFLCEKIYIDHGVKTGLSQNGIQQTRDALAPNFYDVHHEADIDPPRRSHGSLSMTTGVFSNQLTGKYSYNVDYYKLGTWGGRAIRTKLASGSSQVAMNT